LTNRWSAPTDREIISVLKRVVKRLRKAFPKTRLIFRADSHHTQPAVMDWLEKQPVDFATGAYQAKSWSRARRVIRNGQNH
jgi:hypothetical protein